MFIRSITNSFTFKCSSLVISIGFEPTVSYQSYAVNCKRQTANLQFIFRCCCLFLWSNININVWNTYYYHFIIVIFLYFMYWAKVFCIIFLFPLFPIRNNEMNAVNWKKEEKNQSNCPNNNKCYKPHDCCNLTEFIYFNSITE